MPSLIHPQESISRWEFDGTDALYRDHRGKRVLTDAEGFGHFAVECALEGLEIYVDDCPFDGHKGVFHESFLVNCPSPGPSLVRMAKGRISPPEGQVEPVGEHFVGPGWVVGAQGPVASDEKHNQVDGLTPAFPLPVFFEAKGQDLQVIRAAPTRCESIDLFTIDDEPGLKARHFAVQNISKVSMLSSFYANGEPLNSAVASHLNAASWDCPVTEGCKGLLIRKRYDRFHGRQRARVLIDGEAVGWWYEPEQDRLRRWGVAEYGIPAEFVEGKSAVRITIDPPAGAPLWSVSAIRIRALF